MYFKRNKGVVWVEFLIVTSTVLLGMFYLIPMLAKYMDLRQSAEQAARYGAWERTVWNGRVGEYGHKRIERSSADFQNEAIHRILGKDSLVYSGQNKDSEMSTFNVSAFHGYNNLPHGTYDELIKKQNGKYLTLSETVVNGKFAGASKIDRGIKLLKGFVNRLPTNTKGYYKNKVNIDANVPSWIDEFGSKNFPNKKITFAASNSILVDSWGAGGNEDNIDKVLAMRPRGSKGVRESQLRVMRGTFLPFPWFAKEIRGGNIEINKVDIDQLLEGEDPDDVLSHVEKIP